MASFEGVSWMTQDQDDWIPEVDLQTERAHPARVYDYLLGGKTNFAADRAAGDTILTEWPGARVSTRAARAVMHRMTRRLATVHGVRQFLDIGTGIPTAPNLHEVAQSIDPATRVVYVDNDPIVLAHARALLSSTREGRTAYVDCDLRDPEKLLADPALLGATLDLTQPVALTLINIVHFLSDEVALPLVAQLLEALPAGSFLALTAGTADSIPERAEVASRRYREAGIENHLRSQAGVARFFDGLELDDPGVVLINRWYPELDDGPALADNQVMAYAGLGRKP